MMTVDPLDDSHQRAWRENVRPTGWKNPTPADRYNLVVIGAGAAGLVTSAIAAGLGARVALIERERMGGDCLNTGCVPSKAILRAARGWADLNDAAAFGITLPGCLPRDFGVVMARMRRLRAEISPTDSADRYQRMGVDLFFGEGRFLSDHHIEVGGQTLTFARAVICTGTRPALPNIPGLQAAGFLTNETLFDLVDLPPRLVVIGGGPVGCEMAQAFARFGSRVTLIQKGARILPRDDADAAAIVHRQLVKDGVRIFVASRVAHLERRGDARIIYVEEAEGRGESAIETDAILVAVGRTPNVEGLGLEAIGLAYDPRAGVQVNTALQTTRPNIFAAGDICSALKFTHMADAMAQIVVQNALFTHPFGLGLARIDRRVVPWCTYTTPEIAHVGLHSEAAARQGISVDTFTAPMAENDRARLDGDTEGFVRVHVKRGSDRIIGATIVATHAGEMIGEATLAIQNRLGLSAIGGVIHPYPTQSDAIRKAAVAWRKGRLTDGAKRLLRRWFAWTRR